MASCTENMLDLGEGSFKVGLDELLTDNNVDEGLPCENSKRVNVPHCADEENCSRVSDALGNDAMEIILSFAGANQSVVQPQRHAIHSKDSEILKEPTQENGLELETPGNSPVEASTGSEGSNTAAGKTRTESSFNSKNSENQSCLKAISNNGIFNNETPITPMDYYNLQQSNKLPGTNKCTTRVQSCIGLAQLETRKYYAAWNHKLITDLLNISFEARQAHIPSLRIMDTLNVYPALKHSTHVEQEFERMMEVSAVDFEKNVMFALRMFAKQLPSGLPKSVQSLLQLIAKQNTMDQIHSALTILYCDMMTDGSWTNQVYRVVHVDDLPQVNGDTISRMKPFILVENLTQKSEPLCVKYRATIFMEKRRVLTVENNMFRAMMLMFYYYTIFKIKYTTLEHQIFVLYNSVLLETKKGYPLYIRLNKKVETDCQKPKNNTAIESEELSRDESETVPKKARNDS